MSSVLATEGIAVDKIRVVLADDHREVIAKIRGILGDEFDVLEAVENGHQAVSAVLALKPDVFVTDISMPLLNGLQAARRIQNANPRVKIIFVTIHEDRDFIAAAFRLAPRATLPSAASRPTWSLQFRRR